MVAVRLCVFAGQVPSGLDRGGPPAVQEWHAMEFHDERSARSASGVLHLMPLGTAALCGKQRRAGGRGGRHSGGMLWGMGQMGPVLVSVSFTLNSVTKLNSVNPRARAEHLDTVLRAPAQGGRAEVRARTPSGEARRHIKTGRSHPHVSRMCKL